MTIVSFRRVLRVFVVFCLCTTGAWRASYALPAPDVDSGPESAEGTDKNLPDAPAVPGAVTVKGLPMAILKDQIQIWTSPVRARVNDLVWLLPLGATTGVTLSTDSDTMHRVPVDRTYNKNNVN